VESSAIESAGPWDRADLLARFKRAFKFGIAEDMAQTRGMIARLREHERAANRAAPLEITVSQRLGGQLTLEQARELAAMGVSRIILFGGPGTRDALAAMEHYQEHLLSKF